MAERAGGSHSDTNQPSEPCGSAGQLCASTTGSVRVDLATACTTELKDTQVRVVPTSIKGPLENGLSALLIGRSSATKQGLFVLPGLIDADYEGEIKIMMWTPSSSCLVPAGAKIAQLIYFRACLPRTATKQRGARGSGSTGAPQICWSQSLQQQRPLFQCKVSHSQLKGSVSLCRILDSGADVTVMASTVWPPFGL